jgi:hypothetical protein
MADQLGSGMVAGHSAQSSSMEGGQLSPAGAGGPATSHHGRPVSWVAVGTMMAAFLIGGIGLISGPIWWLFWVGAAMCVVGGLLALATHIFEDWY